MSEKITILAEVGDALIPIATTTNVAALAELLRAAPEVDADDRQLAELERKFQARIDRRQSDVSAGSSGD